MVNIEPFLPKSEKANLYVGKFGSYSDVDNRFLFYALKQPSAKALDTFYRRFYQECRGDPYGYAQQLRYEYYAECDEKQYIILYIDNELQPNDFNEDVFCVSYERHLHFKHIKQREYITEIFGSTPERTFEILQEVEGEDVPDFRSFLVKLFYFHTG